MWTEMEWWVPDRPPARLPACSRHTAAAIGPSCLPVCAVVAPDRWLTRDARLPCLANPNPLCALHHPGRASPLQISAAELASAMTFLREQMGEEELRHLLEMLSVEAGASEPGSGSITRGRWGAVQAVWAAWHGAAREQQSPPVLAAMPFQCCLHPARTHARGMPAGKDGGIDVNRLMELADEAEEEEENGPHPEQQ